MHSAYVGTGVCSEFDEDAPKAEAVIRATNLITFANSNINSNYNAYDDSIHSYLLFRCCFEKIDDYNVTKSRSLPVAIFGQLALFEDSSLASAESGLMQFVQRR